MYALALAIISLLEADRPGKLRTDKGEMDMPVWSKDFDWLWENYLAIRTHWLDEKLLALCQGQSSYQVVFLAAGLDGRAQRLPWPANIRIFELDLPVMTEFKRAIVERAALPSRASVKHVSCDLATDWDKTLAEAGYEAAKPTIWLLEGILQYFNPGQADKLLATITSLSFTGSHLIACYAVGDLLKPARESGHDTAADFKNYEKVVRTGPCVTPQEWWPKYGWRIAESTDVATHAREVARDPPPAMNPELGGAVCFLTSAVLRRYE